MSLFGAIFLVFITDKLLFDSQHLKEYTVYGLLGGDFFAIPVWYYLYSADYKNGYIVYGGSTLFMFVIMTYAFKLTRRKAEYKSSVIMMIAGHMAVLSGIIFSVIFSFILCFVYIQGFFSGHRPDYFLANAPEGLNTHNSGTLFQNTFTCHNS